MTPKSGSDTPDPESKTRKRAPQVNGGFLNVNKPAGMTSMDVIRVVRRLTGQKRVGHGGTLDPDATGVLPICIGRASRFIDRFVEGRKIYEATAVFGIATDTYDASGRVTAETDPLQVTRDTVEEALPRFTGHISQVPPMYSAVKIRGERLYKLARKGEEIERPARDVVVYELELMAWELPEIALRIECGSGFYVRSLIHDLGAAVDNSAHMTGLIRKQVGKFTLDDAVALEELEVSAEKDEWESLLYPIDQALLDLPAVVVEPHEEAAIADGRPVGIGGVTVENGGEVRAYGKSGVLIAVMKYDDKEALLRPVRVLVDR